MDNFSDNSSRCELDSVTSTDSLNLFADEFRLRHVSTPDVSREELARRLQSLELENERLRIDLENCNAELSEKVASNQGLKDKITELYIEAQATLQERLSLENALKNAKNEAAAADYLTKLHQAQIHDLRASRKGLQMELDTYRKLARQKHEVALSLTARCKQSDASYIELSKKFKEERQELKEEVGKLRARGFFNQATATATSVNRPQADLSPDLSTKLETTEDELRSTKVELKTVEQRLLGVEAAKASLENSLTKHRELISSMETNVEKCEMEKDEVKNRLNAVQVELNKMKSEKDALESTLLISRQEHGQVEQAIVQLKAQLNKMIAQYKLIKTRNVELESKTALLQKLQNENKILKSRSFEANSSLFKKLRDAKRKIRSLEGQIDRENSRKQLFQARIETDASLHECLKRALERNKELNERLKFISMTNTFEESIDEGYGDGFVQSTVMDLPSPAPLDPRLLQSVSRALTDSKNFLCPVQPELEELRKKLENLAVGERARLLNSGQMSPSSPRNNARSVA